MEYNFGSALLSFRLKPHFEAFAKKSRLRVCFFLLLLHRNCARTHTCTHKMTDVAVLASTAQSARLSKSFAHAHARTRARTKTVGDVLLCALNCILEKTDRSSKRLLSAFKDFDFYSNDRPKHKNSDAA